jgi:hypothetical protein
LVFQQFNLIGSLRVEDNLAFQARLAGRHDPRWQAHLVQRLGLSELLGDIRSSLSGGQQQRVALGRALASRHLLLADEPTGSLDEATSDDVLRCCWNCSTTRRRPADGHPQPASRRGWPIKWCAGAAARADVRCVFSARPCARCSAIGGCIRCSFSVC